MSAIVRSRLNEAGFKTRGSSELLGVKGGFKLSVLAPAIVFSGDSRNNTISFTMNRGAFLSKVEDILARYSLFQDAETMKRHPPLAGSVPKRRHPWVSLTLLSRTEGQSFLINDDRNRASLAKLVDSWAAYLPAYTMDNLVEKLRTRTEIEPVWHSSLGVVQRTILVRDLYGATLPDNRYLLDWIRPVEAPGAGPRSRLEPFVEWWSGQINEEGSVAVE